MDSEDVRFDFMVYPNPTRRVRATHVTTGTVVEASEGTTWDDNKRRCLVKLRLFINAADPRLAHLPEPAQKVAAEFLSIHDAWETEFEAREGYCLSLEWNDEHAVARFEWYARSYAFVGAGESWNLLGRVFRAGTFDEVDGVRISSHGPLRRSTDFAEFVKRFKRAEGEVQP